MNPYDTLKEQPADPILGLSVLFQQDSRPNKINLGIGAYKTEDGKVALFQSVHEAERFLWEEKRSKSYAPIDGDYVFQEEVLKLIYGPKLNKKRHLCAQTVGCTAALRVSGELLREMGYERIYIPEQTWQNHFLLYSLAGLKTERYPYYDTEHNQIKMKEMLKVLETAPKNSAVIFQVSCHNPVGRDPNFDQWQQIVEVVKKNNLFPVLDSAYQGFGGGLEEDIYPLFLFEENVDAYFLCYSFSKNFGLYGERVGALLAYDSSEKLIERIRGNIKHFIRSFYSSPSIHGARIVKAILQSEDLKHLWQQELYEMQQRLKVLRKDFVSSLKKTSITKNYEYIEKDQGLFSLMGLSEHQVLALREKHGIYIVKNGRMNIAGLSSKNMDTVSNAIDDILKAHA